MCDMIAISKSVIKIVLGGYVWYNCNMQEYHNFALYKMFFIGNPWQKHDQYECQNVARRVENF